MSLPSLLCSFQILLIITFTYQTKAVYDEINNYHYFCDQSNNKANYTANSTYHKNLNTVLTTLTSNTDINYGFYNFSFGENNDRVYSIGLCRGDLLPNDCRRCLSGSRSNLTSICPNQREAIFWSEDERCMLRYSDRLILGVMEDVPMFYSNNLNDSVDVNLSNEVVTTLLGNLTSKAVKGDSRMKYAAGSLPGPKYEVIYGLVQCTPDLSENDCNSCLVENLQQIPGCCKGKIGGRVVRPSCNMRFETSYLFYEPRASPPPPPPSPPPNTTGKSNTSTTIGIAVAVPVAIVGLVFILICIYFKLRKSKKKFEEVKEEEYQDDTIEISEPLQFNFNTISNATNDFFVSNKLGEGGFGVVYKGRLSNGQEIAAKRLSRDSGQGDSEFKNEVLLVAKLQHRNLVRLLGFCLEGRERVLVYEFVHNKSLDSFIFDQAKRAQLYWKIRYKIILGIARGILYLHEDSRLRIIHRDLKASNILLDEEMNPKIADFGMARLFGEDQTQQNTNKIVGTYGYMAPEYVMHGQFSVKSDVFSFGILVLEIVSGIKNSGIRDGENIEYLSSFAWRNWKEGMTMNIIDPALNNDSQNEIMRCIHIGLLCVQENIASRPSMTSVVVMLNSDSVTLPIPLEPAFHMDNRNFQDIKSWGHSSAQESVNETSITELYPR
ncbi:cysteine-rich receptor-like protein kinase 44 isoform X1 [Vicia villosa]|uniref:cysteine-rich receptor-like protein kinase 44 isoform X1 n=1 Tax=Vicia villosa TaxID=3911 RepID=UPI00273C66F0|nr:cysteine-rich receptor-like protein kinase 44 isoform X1 [Vicia villosa]